MKKIILGLTVYIVSLLIFVDAGSIELNPSEGSFGKGCIIGVDVNVDTQGTGIAALDLVIESSMEFYDFVPAKMFPYYFPPVVKGNIIHLVGFSAPSDWINGNGSIGKIYFKSNNQDIDGAIRIYFAGKGPTTDSNLSVPGGVDVLSSVKDGYYKLVPEGECIDEHTIVGGYTGVSYLSGLDIVLKKFDADYKHKKNMYFLETLGAIAVLLILLILLFWYLYKKGYLFNLKHKLRKTK